MRPADMPRRFIAASCCFDAQRNMRSETLTEFWQYRELLYFFAWRDIKVRYRQAAFGAAWAVIQPLLNMIIFTLLFGRVAHFQSGNIPYPIFVYCALLPWTYISGVLGVASMSLVNNDPLLTKVYFPRALLPAGSVLAGLLDFVIGSFLLVGLMFYYHVRAGWALLLSPLVILLMVLLTMGVSMVTAALNVRYRDVRYALPFLIQVRNVCHSHRLSGDDDSAALSANFRPQSLLGNCGRPSRLLISGAAIQFRTYGNFGRCCDVGFCPRRVLLSQSGKELR